MNSTHIRYYMKKLKVFLALKTEMVNHQGIIREVAEGVDNSWIYYLLLLMAGQIALLGLLTDSVAVVIGAMLISPLMGPIISSGLALTIGDLMLARRAFRTIATSVVLTILISALFTFFSPLKEPTAEILARVRPNIYDLFVAMLSGIVGTVALCTKRNYLITATGVAVATAVIPPLSVVGYGLGTGQIMLAGGGFLLFFTNFVAIVLTSDLVFFIMGFRTSHHETIQHSQRTRLLVIGTLMTVISIPLIYTLAVDIKKTNNNKKVERVLKQHLNKEDASRMTSYSYRQRKKDKSLMVMASVNTVTYIEKPIVTLMEKELSQSFNNPVDIHLEQILVASDNLPEQIVKSALNNGPEAKENKPETPAEISTKAGRLVSQSELELVKALTPFPLSDTRLTFSNGREPLLVTASLQRDYPISEDERLLLARQLERSLGLPVSLAITQTALFPRLTFADDGSLTPESSKALDIISQLPDGIRHFRFMIESNGSKNAKKTRALINQLKKYGASESDVSVRTSKKKDRSTELSLYLLRR